MRTTFNHPRLRLVALACCGLSACFAVYGNLLMLHASFVISISLLAILLFAVGVAFWLLARDPQAGICFDSKGLLLNLGHSTAFVAWANIEAVGICTRRESLLALGSRQQIGVVLRDVQPYIQSYEERLPAARGPFAWALRQIERVLRPLRRADDELLLARLANSRTRTGYDVLVPEAFLGRSAQEFMALIERYQVRGS